jgi:hypothetical protein
MGPTEFKAMGFSSPSEPVSYLACPRCGLVVMQGSDQDGSPLCRDCMAEDETTVRMNVMVLPEGPPPAQPH